MSIAAASHTYRDKRKAALHSGGVPRKRRLSDEERAIGQRIHEALARTGQTHQALANHLGIERAGVSQWGQSGLPKLNRIAAIADFLKVDLHWLMTGEPSLTEDARKAAETAGRLPPYELAMWFAFAETLLRQAETEMRIDGQPNDTLPQVGGTGAPSRTRTPRKKRAPF